MESFLIPIDERLSHTGDTYAIDVHIPLESLSLAKRHFDIPMGVDVKAVLSNVGQGILLTGMVLGRAHAVCDRCLEETVLDLSAELGEYYLFEAPAYDDNSDDDEDFLVLGDDTTIDLTEAVYEALALELPFVVLCQEDCRGLCPVCGANLNKKDCGHTAAIEQNRKNNPFSVLESLMPQDISEHDADTPGENRVP